MGHPMGSHKEYDHAIKISRKEAVSVGYPVYWTGKPCVYGHVAHRYRTNRQCVMCGKAAGRKAHKKEYLKDLEGSGIDMDIRRKIENAQIDALTVVDDWDY